MTQRVQELSVATMAAESLQLLLEIARNEGVTDLDRRVIRHKPSLSAADKQAMLPDLLVQKTVTILIENTFVLCSSIGDLKISRKLLGEIAVPAIAKEYAERAYPYVPFTLLPFDAAAASVGGLK